MLEKLESYVEQGLLKRSVSPCGELVLYDYTEKCQFDKLWDEVTLNHRGTVYSLKTGEVVAKAFPKFFNWSELLPSRQKELANSKDFQVFEKLDGSLGILYFYKDSWRMNTRGSFTSDQAIRGLELLESQVGSQLKTDYTYLVEIIYPENRIVVDYKGESKLVFLSSYHTKSGVEAGHMPFKNRRIQYDFESIQEVQAKLKTLPFNEEGYVVKFADGSRAKFKGDEYVEMHRLISGLSPLTLWERMEMGIVSKEFLSTIPEEFRPQYEDIAVELEKKHNAIFIAAKDRTYSIAKNVLDINLSSFQDEHRKPLGLYLKDNQDELNVYMFPYLLKRIDVVHELIKKQIRPTGNML